jgi:hypothetical protein
MAEQVYQTKHAVLIKGLLISPHARTNHPEQYNRRREHSMKPKKHTVLRLVFLSSFFLLALPTARADQHYSQEVFFDTSLSPHYYTYAHGTQSAPSTLKLIDGHLPIETAEYISGPNALELSWQSQTYGGWDAQIDVPQWRNRTIDWAGDTLYLWLYSPEAIPAADLPRIAFADSNDSHTAPQPFSAFTGGLTAHHWTRIRIPLDSFKSTTVRPFTPTRTISIVFAQSSADAKPHTLYLDDIRIESSQQLTHAPAAPTHLEAKAYERHIDLHWQAANDPAIAQYVIYRSLNNSPMKAIGVQRYGVNRFSDFLGDPHATASYQITARTSALTESPRTAAVSATTHPMTDDEILTMVQEANFRYNWEACEPISGMARESQPGVDDLIATGASGFGIMAIVVGADRHFVTHNEALDRMLQITRFLEHADRFHGVWPHFLSGKTGHAIALFGIYDNGADLVETSFLMQGLLTARQYFSADTAKEKELRDRINSLWRSVDWDWFRATPKRDALYWHWSPDYAFHIAFRLEGWNETMITYLLASASPTHAVPPTQYDTGYTHEGAGAASSNLTDASGAVYGIKHTYFGIPLEQGYVAGSPGPLFFTQYSYLGYDPRGVRDKFTNYFRTTAMNRS